MLLPVVPKPARNDAEHNASSKDSSLGARSFGHGGVMPFTIAALVYGVLAALVLTLVAVIGLARGRQPGWAVLAGAAGSLAGFLLGCAAAVLVCVAPPNIA